MLERERVASDDDDGESAVPGTPALLRCSAILRSAPAAAPATASLRKGTTGDSSALRSHSLIAAAPPPRRLQWQLHCCARQRRRIAPGSSPPSLALPIPQGNLVSTAPSAPSPRCTSRRCGSARGRPSRTSRLRCSSVDGMLVRLRDSVASFSICAIVFSFCSKWPF